MYFYRFQININKDRRFPVDENLHLLTSEKSSITHKVNMTIENRKGEYHA